MIATALNIAERQVNNTLTLLEGGATIPFISRYRKEATGGLDEVQIGEIKERYDKEGIEIPYPYYNQIVKQA